MSREMPEEVVGSDTTSEVTPDATVKEVKEPTQVEAPEGAKERDPELEELKTEVADQLARVREKLEFVHSLDGGYEKDRERAQSLGNQADPKLVEGYTQHKTDIVVLEGMLRDLEDAGEYLDQGRKVMGVFYPIRGILDKHAKRFRDDFEPPVRE